MLKMRSMFLRSVFLFCLIWIVSLSGAWGQYRTGKLQGKVVDEKGGAIPFAFVTLDSTTLGTMADEHGDYLLSGIEPGRYKVTASSMGYSPRTRTVQIVDSGVVSLHFTLLETVEQMDAIVFTIPQTEAQKIKASGFQVEAIHTRPMVNLSADVNKVLSSTAGVRIRENGGLGSGFSFSLNGFSGNQIRFFLDGIPMDNFGSSLTLNNIPINLAERIEIYKGVVPVWLGSDALGGAINIVTNRQFRNFLDVSYSYGSFNTRRSSVNFAVTDSATGLTARGNLFQNYSDNNYWVEVDEIIDYSFTERKIRVRRFHDAYKSQSAILDFGVLDRKYADQLLVGIVVSGSDKEIQTAATMERVFGERRQLSSTLMPTFKYQKKDLFLKGLDLSTYASYNFGHDQTVDTARSRVYMWDGSQRYKPSNGESAYTMYRYSDNQLLVNTNLSYVFSENHALVANYTFNRFDRKGEDEVNPNNQLYRNPQIVSKSIIGLGYRFDWKKRFTVSAFAKQYLMSGQARYMTDVYTYRTWNKKDLGRRHSGLGLAAQWTIRKGLQARASYENAYRLPEGWELFGNGVNLIGNEHIESEKSRNFNLGLSYRIKIKEAHRLLLEGGFLYRRAEDYIREEVGMPNSEVINEPAIEVAGLDANIRYEYKDRIRLSMNGTWQNIISLDQYDSHGNELDTYLNRVPNVPYLFANADITFQFHDLISARDLLAFGYRVSMVDEYFLKWESYGARDTKLIIPRQYSHAVHATYSLKNSRYNISVECTNLFDAKLYDNFRLQKPGRAFYVKLRYFLSKI